MSDQNKPIAFLNQKMQILKELLKDYGLISNTTDASLAIFAQINVNTMKYQISKGNLSTEFETALCRAGVFLKTDPGWNDSDGNPSIVNTEKNVPLDYAYLDTPAKFREMLHAKWGSTKTFRLNETASQIKNREIGHHQITDSSQGATLDTGMKIFLEVSFGPYHCSGIRYGFTKAIVHVSVICKYGSSANARFALGDKAPFGRKATLLGRGTAKNPSWEIESTDRAEMLDGSVSTTNTALLDLKGFQDGTLINSSLTVDPYDAILVGREDAAAPVPQNAGAIIQLLCALNLSQQTNENGRIELSQQTHLVASLHV